jgi:hypothetical protein
MESLHKKKNVVDGKKKCISRCIVWPTLRDANDALRKLNYCLLGDKEIKS